MVDLAYPNWSTIIERLEQRLTHLEIALEVGRSEPWVGLVKRGAIKHPPWPQGDALLRLDARVMAENSSAGT